MTATQTGYPPRVALTPVHLARDSRAMSDLIEEPEEDESPDRAMQSLLDLFDLEPLEVDLFRARNPNTCPGGRVFDGLVASQALRAAIATVDVPHHIHSFHSYFMRPGQPGVPMVFRVDRVRDGRSFTTRVVTVMQHGEATFTMTASFHKDGEEGIDYQLPRAADVPSPE